MTKDENRRRIVCEGPPPAPGVPRTLHSYKSGDEQRLQAMCETWRIIPCYFLTAAAGIIAFYLLYCGCREAGACGAAPHPASSLTRTRHRVPQQRRVPAFTPTTPKEFTPAAPLTKTPYQVRGALRDLGPTSDGTEAGAIALAANLPLLKLLCSWRQHVRQPTMRVGETIMEKKEAGTTKWKPNPNPNPNPNHNPNPNP
eukprot:scaffold92593_cov51-Phaeocystis_antarctica.AAC.6